MKDLELKIRLAGSTSIGSWGLEAQLRETVEQVRMAKFLVEIFSRNFGSRLFAFWPDCGECFAPFESTNEKLFAVPNPILVPELWSGFALQ